jgi:hypothetical protein
MCLVSLEMEIKQSEQSRNDADFEQVRVVPNGQVVQVV